MAKCRTERCCRRPSMVLNRVHEPLLSCHCFQVKTLLEKGTEKPGAEPARWMNASECHENIPQCAMRYTVMWCCRCLDRGINRRRCRKYHAINSTASASVCFSPPLLLSPILYTGSNSSPDIQMRYARNAKTIPCRLCIVAGVIIRHLCNVIQ